MWNGRVKMASPAMIRLNMVTMRPALNFDDSIPHLRGAHFSRCFLLERELWGIITRDQPSPSESAFVDLESTHQAVATAEALLQFHDQLPQGVTQLGSMMFSRGRARFQPADPFDNSSHPPHHVSEDWRI